VIYPPQSGTGGVRPDLVAVDPRGTVRAWIEIELGGEDTNQLNHYREVLVEPVKSIVGLRDSSTEYSLSLEELASVASECLQEILDRQQARNVQIFVDLVSSLARTAVNFDYVTPGDGVLSDGFLVTLHELADDFLVSGKPPVDRGKLMISTISQRGWTLRVQARNSYSSVSVLWMQFVGTPVIRVPSHEHLARYLSHEAVDSYRAYLLEATGVDINALSGGQNAGVDEARLLENRADLMAVLRLLSVAAL
jgi:hypothetical protein